MSRFSGLRRSPLSISLLILAAVARPVPAHAQSDVAIEVRQAARHDVSRPLREIPVIPAFSGEHRERPPKPIPVPPQNAGPDSALQTQPSGTLNATSSGSFDGIGIPNYAVNSAPSDTNGSAGTTQYVQWVNEAFAVFDKSTGAMVYGPANGNTLWSGFGGPCQTNNDGDPIVLFDKAAQRWIFTQFSVSQGTPYMQCVAVSTTSDATGPYARYAFSYTNFNDYPKIGVWPDGYYVTYNMFSATNSKFVGGRACAWNRAQMLAGQAATEVCAQLSSSFGGLLPADLDGSSAPPAGSPGYFVSFGSNSLNLWKYTVNWTTPASSIFAGPTSIPVAAFAAACSGGGTCIPQSGTSQKLDSLADRLMFRLAYRNFGDHESLVVNHSVTAGTSVGVRWYELRSPGTTPVVYQQGTYAPDATFRWMGSVAMDSAGNLLLGYSVSSSSSNPSIRMTGRLATDPLNTLQSETSVYVGGGSQLTNLSRWGDYSSVSVDPSDDCTFWFTTEYLKSSGTYNWSTRIASFSFPGCGGLPAPPAAPSISATAGNAQVTLSWTAVSGADSYKIYRGTTSGGETLLASGIATAGYTDNVVTNGTTYYYQVSGVNTGGEGSRSNEISATPQVRLNVATQANGGVASASTTYSGAYPVSAVNNGDRKGLNWGSGGGWNDATASVYPDWVQINFNGVQSIGEIDVFTLQDNYAAPLDPTLTMTFTQYGITAFEVQYWNGSAWTDVPGGNVTNNNLVWTKFVFSPISTDRIRVLVNNALSSYSRITEIEAWTASGGGGSAPSVTLTSPANGTVLAPPATVNLSATASENGGTISKVEFYRDSTLVATATTAIGGVYTGSDTNVSAGSYSYTAKAYDGNNVTTTSAAAAVVVSASANVAAQANGGVASASSTYSSAYAVSAVNNGDRKGLNWGSGGGWNDATASVYPDWVQINFNGVQSIGEIDVFTLQDNYTAPLDPTLTMTFTQYGITAFEVQYWNGSAWVDVPGGNVTNNNLVWSQFVFSAISTDRIRVLVNNALSGYSRITEIEAWTASGGSASAPTVTLTSPANGTVLTPPATVNLSATASEAGGTISKVEFYRDSTLVATSTTPVGGAYTGSDTNVGAGSYSYTAKAYDGNNVTTTSAAATVVVSASLNVAAQANGGVASASSTYSSAYPVSAVNNGDRKGLNWGSGGGWNDATTGVYPDWVQINFNGVQSIGEIDVFTVQDNFAAPLDPTLTMTFTQYGITAFEVQYWTGSAWVDVPGGNATNNNLVRSQFVFSPISTDRIRVLVNNALSSYSRITEIEAWTAN